MISYAFQVLCIALGYLGGRILYDNYASIYESIRELFR